uniref:PS II complex 12 kDa extrinsic protein n=1 Tax=Entomoneis paludosa TaxID=265537 RepID=A0A7S2Y766_9STRA|eukprot:CAMPEP_0172445330 /NCGR_PEP_ID=MMETSP1065-20121228/5168_1 /TAXON_ID=265537 /ORGANISM="Amphiprora paludosa, Strain CCMP125" /LENGTH=160 /DNA_ID=CAMNT_0013196129 /DNA_START=33 /DNA_END=515 /DNA_ORIENTATION=-
MKVAAVFVSLLSLAVAFVPQQQSARSSTEVKALFDDIFGMDLFAPNKEVNDYGSRNKKNLKVGDVGSNSYVPNGLSLEEYKKVRAADEAKKASNYQKNVAKAGKFLDFDKFYEGRGTAEGGNWLKAPGRGHTFAKTKYDFSGEQDDTKGWGDALGNIFSK